MKLQEPTPVVVGGNNFYIRPFSAFTAANISGAAAGPKFCPDCGTPTSGTKFCGNCGRQLIS